MVKIEPFETAKVGFIGRARAFPFEELKNPREVGVVPVTLGKVHVGQVSRASEPVHGGAQGLVNPADLVTLVFGFATSELGLCRAGQSMLPLPKDPRQSQCRDQDHGYAESGDGRFCAEPT